MTSSHGEADHPVRVRSADVDCLGNGVTALQAKAGIRDFAASPGNYKRMKACGVLIGMQQTFKGMLDGPATLTPRHELGQTGG